MSNLQVFPDIKIDGYLFMGQYNHYSNSIVACVACTEYPSTLTTELASVMLQSYIAKSLGYDIYKDDDHWALHLKLPKLTTDKHYNGDPMRCFVKIKDINISAAKKRFSKQPVTVLTISAA